MGLLHMLGLDEQRERRSRLLLLDAHGAVSLYQMATWLDGPRPSQKGAHGLSERSGDCRSAV
jgi:hypothetical protein